MGAMRAVQRSVGLAQLEYVFATLAETSHRLEAEKFQQERVLMEYKKRTMRISGAIDFFRIVSEEPVGQT